MNSVRDIRARAFLPLVALASFALVDSAQAGARIESAAGAGAESATPAITADDIWGLAEFYRDDSNPIVQSIAFRGRFHLDYATVDSSQGDYDDWVARRTRVGFKAKLFGNFTLHSEAALNLETADPVYVRLTDSYVSWSPNPAFELKIGKQTAFFTLDGSDSSNRFLTIDANNLTRNVYYARRFIPGVSASGKAGAWRYRTGLYSGGSRSPEFGNFDGTGFLLASLGYDFAEAFAAEQALLTADYVYQDPDANNSFTRPFRHVGSLNFRYDTGGWGFRSDLAAGRGIGTQSDVYGVVAMPFYNITEKLQVVGRYTYVESADPNGVRLNLYEFAAVSGLGEEYQEFYAGLNYYIYGHKLKIQTGVKYARMRDRAGDGGAYDGWGWTTGLRIYW